MIAAQRGDSLVGAVAASRESVSGGDKTYDALFIAIGAVDPHRTRARQHQPTVATWKRRPNSTSGSLPRHLLLC
jgi:hypothetical protein